MGVVQNISNSSGLSSYSIAVYDSLELNPNNIAAFTDISHTTITINAFYNRFFGENSLNTYQHDDINFNGAMISVPLIRKKFNFSAAMLPYTYIDQRIQSQTQFGQNNVVNSLVLRGGLNRLHFSSAYKINNKLSIALGYEYIFGKISEEVLFKIDDAFDSELNLIFNNLFSASSFLGAVHYKTFDWMHNGLMFRSPGFGTVKRQADTESDQVNEEIKEDLNLPFELNLGAEFFLSGFLKAGLDIRYQNWQDGYQIEGSKIPGYNDYFRIAGGIQTRATERRFARFSETVSYKAGIFYGELSTLNNGEKVNELGGSVGVTMPIQRFRSQFSLTFFASNRGDLSKNKLEELIFGLGISITANELWFTNIDD